MRETLAGWNEETAMLKESVILKRTALVSFIIFLLGLTGGLCQAQENITITTYYPAPYGIYRTLRIIPGNVFPTCNAANEGTIYFSNTLHRLFICEQLASGYGLGGIFWASPPGNDNYIYPETAGSVGIGTNTPSTTSPTNGQTGNLDVNDVYIRSELKWASKIAVAMPPPSALLTADSEKADCPDNTYMCGFNCTGSCDTGSMQIRCCYFN